MTNSLEVRCVPHPKIVIHTLNHFKVIQGMRL